MSTKALPYIFLAILVFAAVLIRRYNGHRTRPAKEETVNRNSGIDRRISFLEYTQHAKCRMECRQVTQAEVKYILQNGEVNYRKSDAKGHPCPTYALEGYSPDKQHLRVVFVQCDFKTKVVTCIDLDEDFACDCPGDDNKNERR